MSYVNYKQEGSIAVITLNRPERLNAIGTELLADLDAALSEAINADDVDVLVLTGSGRAFCAGDDRKELDLSALTEEQAKAHIHSIQKITHHLMGCDKPVIGAVHGYAVGGGFEWMLNCDMVVAGDDITAFFPEMRLGFFFTGGVTHLLAQTLGHQRSMELLLLGEKQNAHALLQLGLINRVVPRADMLATAMQLAQQVAALSRPSVARLKSVRNHALGEMLWTAVDQEEHATIEAFLRPDAQLRATRF
ncbi:MAG: enoyl-CoA hydratase/isomerase family protein [Alcaligenaceae bacterium]|nr:enoyl-CoA hydratase/isomerase family protein [Alcaligenaceae bacterium]